MMIINVIIAVIIAAITVFLWFTKTVINLMVWLREDHHRITEEEIKEFTISLIELLSSDDD
jgi:sensor domain CHASE-containing protein